MEVIVGDKTYEVSQLRLKKWVEFESLKENVTNEAKHGNVEGFSEALFSRVSLCVNVEGIEDLPWVDVASAYAQLQVINQPSIKFPIFITSIKEQKQIGWDYEERSWYVWAHALAKAFGWLLEYIAELKIDDAIALIEEIYVQEQLDKEWEWSLSEIAYPYEANTKVHKFHPLPRPLWMDIAYKDKKEEIMKTKLPKFMIPIGNIVPAKWMKDGIEH